MRQSPLVTLCMTGHQKVSVSNRGIQTVRYVLEGSPGGCTSFGDGFEVEIAEVHLAVAEDGHGEDICLYRDGL